MARPSSSVLTWVTRTLRIRYDIEDLFDTAMVQMGVLPAPDPSAFKAAAGAPLR